MAHFLPLFWFLLCILESLDPRDKVKRFIESRALPFCLLEQTLFSMYLCVFLYKLDVNNEPHK